MPRPSIAAVAASLGLAACLASCAAQPLVPPSGREQVIDAVARRSGFLEVALFLSPFYGDDGRVLLSDRNPADLPPEVEEPGGAVLPVPKPVRVLMPGTPVWVETVQFPTAGVLLERPPGTPRHDPWLLLLVAGEPREAVFLLSPALTRGEDLVAQARRVVTVDDPTPLLRRLPLAHRDAIGRKEVVEGMSRTAVTMAWGHPDRIVQDRTSGQEEWVWRGGGAVPDRRATFQDDRLVRSGRANPPAAR